MSCNVIPTPDFKKAFKRLNKKHKSLIKDLLELSEQLESNPNLGTGLGNGVFKVRMKISSKNKGKSGGARIITYLITEDNELYLIYIYDKSDIENITKQKIQQLLDDAGL